MPAPRPVAGWNEWLANGLGWPTADMSHKALVSHTARAWAVVLAAAVARGVDALVPGSFILLLFPLEWAAIFTATLVADCAMRKQSEMRLNSQSALHRQDRRKEELEQNLAMLGRANLPPDRLAELRTVLVCQFLEQSSAEINQARSVSESPSDNA